MLAPSKSNRSVVENAEAASWNNRRYVTAAESQGNVRPKGRIGQQMRLVAVRINGVDGQVIGENGVVRRARPPDHFVKPNARSHQPPMNAPNEPRRGTPIRPGP